MCANFCPLVHLCMGFIHHVKISKPVGSLESHSIFWSSAKALGEWLSGTYSTITNTVWSLIIDNPLNFSRNCYLWCCIHLVASAELRSKTTPLLASFLAPRNVISVGVVLSSSWMTASFAFETNSCSVRLVSVLCSAHGSLLISIWEPPALAFTRLFRCDSGTLPLRAAS